MAQQSEERTKAPVEAAVTGADDPPKNYEE